MTLLPPSVLGVLGEGRQAYVAVASTNGPHVTPELYAWSSDRLWFAAATSTLKAKVLRRDPRLGAVVSVAGRSVILTGQVSAYDPRRPLDLVRGALELPRTARALTSYTTRNAPDVLAFVGDAASGKLGARLPPPRILYCLRPERLAVVENDALSGDWGWAGRGGEVEQHGGQTAPVPSGGERAVAAFPGPTALPARWFPEEQRLHVSRDLLDLLVLDEVFPVSVVTDDYAAPGPAAKRGTLVRGQGRIAADDRNVVEVSADRLIEWDGVDTSATDA